MEVEDRRFREMYVNGDAHDMSERTSLCRKVSIASSRSSGSRRGHRQRASPRPACLTQRISVISTASSNTTSGIASDIGKLYTSFEESEGVCAWCLLTCLCLVVPSNSMCFTYFLPGVRHFAVIHFPSLLSAASWYISRPLFLNCKCCDFDPFPATLLWTILWFVAQLYNEHYECVARSTKFSL